MAKDREALQRVAARGIKETQLREKGSKLQQLNCDMHNVQTMIAAEKRSKDDAEREDALREREHFRTREKASQQREEQQRREEIRKRIEAQRRREDLKKQVEEQQRQDEAKQQAEEQQRQKKTQQKQEEMKRQAEEEQRHEELRKHTEELWRWEQLRRHFETRAEGQRKKEEERRQAFWQEYFQTMEEEGRKAAERKAAEDFARRAQTNMCLGDDCPNVKLVTAERQNESLPLQFVAECKHCGYYSPSYATVKSQHLAPGLPCLGAPSWKNNRYECGWCSYWATSYPEFDSSHRKLRRN